MPTLPPILIDSPLGFDYSPDTGLLTVVASGNTLTQTTQNFAVPSFPMTVILRLTQETSRQLLAVLPTVQRLLEQASEGPTKPRSVQ